MIWQCVNGVCTVGLDGPDTASVDGSGGSDGSGLSGGGGAGGAGHHRMEQPGPNEGGGGGGKSHAPKIDIKALADCIFQEFSVMLTSFSASQSGDTGDRHDNINGSFSGFGPDLLQVGPEYHFDFFSQIDVVNSVQTNSTIEITQMFPKSGTTSFGYTDPKSPYTNVAASDLTDPQEMLQAQIYELGNSLSAITGQPGGQSSNEDDAKALQKCYNQKTGDQPIH